MVLALAMVAGSLVGQGGCRPNPPVIGGENYFVSATGICFSPDGQRVAFAGKRIRPDSAGRQVHWLNAATGKFQGSAPVYAVQLAWLPTGAELITAGPSGLVRVDTRTRTVSAPIPAGANAWYGLGVDQSGQVIVGLRLLAEWDGRTACPQVFSMDGSQSPKVVGECSASRNAHSLAVAGNHSPTLAAISFQEETAVEVWVVPPPNSRASSAPEFVLPTSGPCQLAFAADGERLAVLSAKGLEVFRIADSKVTREWQSDNTGPPGDAQRPTLAISGNGRTVVAARKDELLVFRDGRASQSVKLRSTPWELAVDNKGRRVAVVNSSRGTVSVIELAAERVR